MATISMMPTQQTDEEKDETIKVGGGESTFTSGTSTQNKPTSSGRFFNLSNYLKANTGPGQQSLAGKIASNVQNQAQTAKNEIQSGQEQFQKSVAASTPNQQQTNQYLQQIQQDPSKIDQQQFQQYRDAKYTGPQNIQNANQIQTNVGNITQTAKQTGSEAGRFNVLRQMFNKPSYTTGQQRLDQVLLQSNPQELAKLRETQKIAAQTERELGKTLTGAETAARQAEAQAVATRDAIRGGLNTAATTLQSDLTSRAQAENALRTQQYNQALERLRSINLTDSDLEALGLSRGQALYGLKGEQLANFINKGQQATTQNIASAQDIARINALKNLSGQTASQDASTVYNQMYGGLDETPYSYKDNTKEGVQNLVNTQKSLYNTDLQQAYNNIRNDTPLPKNWLTSLNSRSINDNLNQLKEALGRVEGLSFFGNEAYKQREIERFKRPIAALESLIKKYNIGSGIGDFQLPKSSNNPRI